MHRKMELRLLWLAGGREFGGDDGRRGGVCELDGAGGESGEGWAVVWAGKKPGWRLREQVLNRGFRLGAMSQKRKLGC